jgi:hypothetical protein
VKPLSEGGSRRSYALAGGVALLVAIGVRVHNAFHYTSLWGFDALYNWRYIDYLTRSWALPAPEAGWSAAHPPLFYYAGALVARGLPLGREQEVIVLRLLIAAAGLAIAVLCARAVRRIDPGSPRRALLASGLVLFLPVHVYMSAMLSEEIVAAALITVVLAGATTDLATGNPLRDRRAFWLGLAAGAAFLTKLTGVLVIAAAAGAYLLDRWNRRDSATYAPALPALRMTAIALLVGGWFYLRNWIGWGYLYPHGLEVHEIMFTMPPGERFWLDYLRIPLATWTDPQLLAPDLLRSVWGSTYVTWWFDGHRAFLPTQSAAVNRFGTAILVLALVPTAAAVIGAAQGARRALRGAPGPDALLTGMIALTLAGYVAFTWRNPWFVTCKASFLLGLCLPFSVYASEMLDAWMRRGRGVRIALWCSLLLLTGLILFTFTFHELLWNMDHMEKPGVVW